MSATAHSNENKMGTMPVNKLLVSMSLPMIACYAGSGAI